MAGRVGLSSLNALMFARSGPALNVCRTTFIATLCVICSRCFAGRIRDKRIFYGANCRIRSRFCWQRSAFLSHLFSSHVVDDCQIAVSNELVSSIVIGQISILSCLFHDYYGCHDRIMQHPH